MPLIRLPTEHDTSYVPARGPVLLLTCMDLRFLDEIVSFMDHDGQTNRYDHVIFAGAALGALGVPGVEYPGPSQSPPEDFGHWRKTFFDHLDAALELHQIKDVYILEHRDCGAYAKFLGKEGKFKENEQGKEAKCHYKYASQLKSEIETWAQDHPNDKAKEIRVKLFLMGMRGRVEPLLPPEPTKTKKSKSGN